MSSPSSTTEAYVSLAELQRQRMEACKSTETLAASKLQTSEQMETLDTYLAEREGLKIRTINTGNTDEALQSFREANALDDNDNGSNELVEGDEEELYLSPSAPTDSDEDEIRSQQVDSILNGLAQASSPKRAN